jgi:antitoxin (DNA-binding transcriptional repressor) of toxin-antitoxin stability system
MRTISIQDLKARLSLVLRQALSGTTVLVTRHNEAIAQIGPPVPGGVHRGVRGGLGRLEPALRRSGTKGRYLDVLRDDRGEG